MNTLCVTTSLFALLIFATSSISAADFNDPVWEASPAAIRRQMTADPTVTPIKDSASHLSYRGGTLLGQPVRSWRYTLASAGRPPQLAVRFAPTAAFADLYRLLVGKHGSPDEFQGNTRRDAIWTAPSDTLPGLTQNILLTFVTAGRDPRVELVCFDTVASSAPRTELHYTLQRDPHPTAAQLEAYHRITDAMNGAVRFYEKFTVGLVKTDTVRLDPTEATAEGNIDGNIQFGPTDISLRTALHEISHTVGIGTTPEFHRLTVDGRFIGKHALAQLRAITGDDRAVLRATTWHFLPYGLNNPGEDVSIWDYIHHCKMVSAILQDCRELR